jgi:hypothetical protein
MSHLSIYEWFWEHDRSHRDVPAIYAEFDNSFGEIDRGRDDQRDHVPSPRIMIVRREIYPVTRQSPTVLT